MPTRKEERAEHLVNDRRLFPAPEGCTAIFPLMFGIDTVL